MTGGNNGNVYSQTLDAPGLPASLTQTYGYDGVNRLSSVVEGGWSRNYYYDAYGNRAAQGTGLGVNTPDCAKATDPGCGDPGDIDFVANTNRLSTGFAAYDNAGNQTLLNYPGGQPTMDSTITYDAENKQIEFCPGTDTACNQIAATAKTTYHYDGGGNRVKKVVNLGETTVYVYDAFGNLAAEYSDVAPSADPGTHHRTTDHLGSTRLVTAATASVVSRRDFFPFGEEIPGSATYGNRQLVTDGQTDTTYNDPSGYRQQFTGQERDDESKLDYFLARYYSGSLGRFTSPDPALDTADPSIPQSWNRYVYVLNNPLRYVDPFGEDYEDLTEDARKLVDDLYNRVDTGITSDQAAQYYNQLSDSQKATFEAVAFALESIDTSGGGNLLQQVTSIDGILGADPGAGGTEQFRIFVGVKENTLEVLNSLGLDRVKGHDEFDQGFQQPQPEPSLQFNLTVDGRRGELDIDFRYKTEKLRRLRSQAQRRGCL